MTARSRNGSYHLAALAVLVLAALVLAPRPAAAADFGQDVVVTADGNKQEYAASAWGPNGNIYVIWQDDRNAPGGTSDIYMARSVNNGSSFSSAIRVDDGPAGTDQMYPQLAVDPTGKLHAVWSDYRSGVNYRIYYSNSTDNGSTWSPGVMVNYSASGGQYVPSMAIDSSGNLYVVWDDGRSGNHIYFSSSTSGGSSWTAAARLDSSGNAARYPWICWGPDGNITVVWQDSRNTNWDVFMVLSSNGGSSFGSEVNVTKNTTSTSQMWPRVAADSSGGVHVVWDDNRYGNYGVFYGNSSDGQTFSAIPVNDTNTGIAGPPEPPGLAVDASGGVHVCWQDRRGGVYDRIYYSETTAPGTFSAGVRVDNTTTASCHLPCVMVNSNNMPSVVWDDDRNGNLDIFFDIPQNLPPLAPDLLLPANDTWVATGRPTFNWTFRDVNTSDYQGAYQLQLDNSSSFASVDYDSGAVVSTDSTHVPASAIADGIFFWHVRTRDASGLWGPYSAPRVVKIDTAAPAAATPLDAGVWCNSTTVNWSWAPSADALSGVAGYYVCIGTSPGGNDTVDEQWTVLPNFTFTGGVNGTTYYAKVKAVDNASNAGAYGGASDGITVDVSVPSAGVPVDAGVYINSSLVRWSWPPSDDYPSGIAGYLVSIGSAPGTDDILRDSWTATNSTTYPAGQSGVTYYARVRARDNAGNTGAWGGASDGVTVDTSLPLSYTPADNGTYSNITTLYWYWPASFDTTSGIAGYFVTIGTAYGANDTLDGCFTASTSFILAGAANGKTYYCRVLAVDGAGNRGPPSAYSDGITVDTTAPSAIMVTDDGMFTTVTTSVHVSWSSSFDDISGIAEYQFCAGTTPGATDIIPWTSAGQALSATRPGLSLPNGLACYFTVKASNGAGLWSPAAYSDGITVDVTTPSADTPAAEGVWSTSASITWTWTASTDSPSGIAGYYVCIGSTPGASDVVLDAFTSLASYTYAGGQNEQSYYAKIKAADNAGNVGPYGGASDAVTVDVSLPWVPAPRDAGAYSSSPNITFRWNDGIDSPSGIMGYFLSIGTTPGDANILDGLWTNGTSYELAGALGGRTYYAFLRAVDNAGNEGPRSPVSDGITIDLTAPAPVTVGGGGYLLANASFPVSWSMSFDPETPVVGYRWALGTSPGAADIVNWTDAGANLSVVYFGPSIVNGIAYFASVQARNAAGLWSAVSTGAAVAVDTAAPSAFPPVHPGPFSNSSVVEWTWDIPSDPESGVAGYVFFVGTSPGGTDAVNGSWTAEARFAFTGGVNGVTYYASVAARDRAGNQGARAVSSSGVLVDTSRPQAGPPTAPSGYSTVASVGWNWSPPAGAPSGIAGYYVSIGSSPGAEDVVKRQWAVAPSFTFNAGVDGRTYYISVRAQNNAGILGDAVLGTSGVSVDLKAPSGNLTIAGGDSSSAERAVALAISTQDADVSEMMVGTEPGLPGAAWVPFAKTGVFILPEGNGEKTVFVRLRDRAGMESAVFSSRITLEVPAAAAAGGGEQGWLSGERGSLLVLVCVLVAIILVLVVLAVAMNTRRMLLAHLKASREAGPAGGKGEPPKEGPAPPGKAFEERAAAKEQPPAAPQQQSAESDTWVERKPEIDDGRPAATPETAWTTPEQTPASMLDALAAAAREPIPPPAPGQEPAATYEAREGDVVIRADGTEAPAEPKLVSEWSPETGTWAPVGEAGAAEAPPTLPPEPVAPAPAQEQPPLIEDGVGEAAPEPTRAMEDLARTFHAREEAPFRAAPAHEPALPTAAPGQRRSAREIYDALYGRKAVPPVAGTPAPARKAPQAPEQAGTAAPAPDDKKILGKARCAQCRGVIPIYSAERPLKIKCPSCGLEGMIK